MGAFSTLTLSGLVALSNLANFSVSQKQNSNELFDEIKFLNEFNKLTEHQKTKIIENYINDILNEYSHQYKYVDSSTERISILKVKSNLLEDFKKNDRFNLFEIYDVKLSNTNSFNPKNELKEYFNKWTINLKIRFKHLNTIFNKKIEVTYYNHQQIEDEKFSLTNLNNNSIINVFEWYMRFVKENNFPIFNKLGEKILKQIKIQNNWNFTSNNLNSYPAIAKFNNYIENTMWKQYEREYDSNYKPIFHWTNINGWDLVKNEYNNIFNKSLVIGFWELAMKSILNVLKEVGDAVNFECECDKKNKVERIVSEELKDYLDQDITIVDVIVSFLTFGTTLINKTNKLQQEKINNYVLRNHNKLAQFYNENTVHTFTQFLKEGFSNGFMGKLSSSFGGESIKDRAYFIYDKKINKHWNLNNVKINSTAKFRKWFPVWETYTKYGNSYLNIGNNRLSYGAINASQGTWVGTYYGKIENIKNNYYTLHYNADWLEYTNISFEPSYTKISKHIIKERFIKDAKEGINRLLSIKNFEKKDFSSETLWKYYKEYKNNRYPLYNSESNNFEKIKNIIIS